MTGAFLGFAWGIGLGVAAGFHSTCAVALCGVAGIAILAVFG